MCCNLFSPSSCGTGTQHGSTALPVKCPELAACRLLANALHAAKEGGSALLYSLSMGERPNSSTRGAETPLSL